MRLPLTLSIAGHAILLGLLILLAAEIPPPPELTTKGGRSHLADRHRYSDLDAAIDPDDARGAAAAVSGGHDDASDRDRGDDPVQPNAVGPTPRAGL